MCSRRFVTLLFEQETFHLLRHASSHSLPLYNETPQWRHCISRGMQKRREVINHFEMSPQYQGASSRVAGITELSSSWNSPHEGSLFKLGLRGFRGGTKTSIHQREHARTLIFVQWLVYLEERSPSHRRSQSITFERKYLQMSLYALGCWKLLHCKQAFCAKKAQNVIGTSNCCWM